MGKSKTKHTSNIYKFRVRYEKSPLYSVHPVDGAVGGITPRRDIFLNFFQERFKLANESSMEIDLQSQMARETPIEQSKDTIVREKFIGVVLRPEVARSIGKLLIEKAENALKMKDIPISDEDDS